LEEQSQPQEDDDNITLKELLDLKYSAIVNASVTLRQIKQALHDRSELEKKIGEFEQLMISKQS